MRKRTFITFIVLVLFLSFVPHSFGTSVSAQEATVEGNYAPINELNLYYEIHGEGEPIILLHGGLGGIVEFSQLLPILAETRQVIAVELQGHGHTADVDRPLSFEAMADDIAALIEYLGYENADVMGYSLGGGVALQTAIRHPEVVRKLVLISTAFRQDNWYPVLLAGMTSMNADAAQFMLETPMYQFYSSVAPTLDNWSTLVGKVGEMLATNYDWTADVPSVTAPTLIVIGDSDGIRPAAALELFQLLGGAGEDSGMGAPLASQFAILPATSHFSILYRTDLLLPIITPFLDAEAS